ncbi:hypothetical protein GCM10022261_08880 [Brevibacterium daeguense]|uniref:Glycosyl hydrolase family 79 n=1 Tax=Brevibacterium daeguense TaxID=909936 RepID=A0ABP8EHB7_9MICO|nr:hypothetical protein [Brevibacterium daeguense]
MSIEVSSERNQPGIGKNNLGISFEATELADPRWDPSEGNVDELLSELGSPGIRFGGNKLDRSMFWTSGGETAPPGYTTVTPRDLRRVNQTVMRVGSQVTLGIPLGDFDPERGADMAKHAVEIFGDSLLAISIGNEPNGFTADGREGLQIRNPGEWDEDAYVAQAREYVDAIRGAVGDTVLLVGPGAFEGAWMTAFLEADFPGTAALSQHWYATYDCTSEEVPGRGPEWENLVDPLAHESADRLLSIGLEKADAAGVPLWVEETGPTSCPGTNDTSRTHASALWTVDYIFHAAGLGVERMNMHSMLGACAGGAPMSVVCSVQGTGENGEGELVGQPNYHAMRLASLSVGGQFLETELDGGGNMYAYAVDMDTPAAGDEKILVTVVNNNDMAESGGNEVTIDLPEGYTATRAAQIHAPSNAAKSKTGFRELAPFAETGSGVVSSKDGQLIIDLAASSATTIQFAR